MFKGGEMDIPTVHMGGVFKGAGSGQVVPKKALTETPKPLPEVKLPEVNTQAKAAATTSDEAMRARVLAAAQALKNTYAVSDSRFTIFKDVAGDYVTRFTSLRDGSVKYYPQKTLFELAQIQEARQAQFDA